MLTTNDNFKEVSIYCWPGDTEFFKSWLTDTIKFDKKILGVILGDFNFDGKLDFIATTEAVSSKNSTINLYLQKDGFIFGDQGKADKTLDVPAQQPSVFDFAGDMRMGILFSDFDGKRKVAHFNSTKFVLTDFSDYVVSDGTGKCLPLTNW